MVLGGAGPLGPPKPTRRAQRSRPTTVEIRKPICIISPAAQKTELILQTLDLAPQAAEQAKCLSAHAMMPAVVLEAPQFVECIVVEK
jgi:hypothetical protein